MIMIAIMHQPVWMHRIPILTRCILTMTNLRLQKPKEVFSKNRWGHASANG